MIGEEREKANTRPKSNARRELNASLVKILQHPNISIENRFAHFIPSTSRISSKSISSGFSAKVVHSKIPFGIFGQGGRRQ